jgi:chorismate mutase
MKKLFAIRGASQCENTEDDLQNQISVMYEEMLSKNNLDENDIVSVIFSVTSDLDALNPSCALRKNGWAQELSLFSVMEPESRNSLERTVRVLVHCYLDENSRAHHVYRNGAEVLRPDRS